MTDPEIRKFAFSSFAEMNYDPAEFDDDTVLGPAGADLDSVSLAELVVRFEEQYGIEFSEDESEQLAVMTIGEFCGTVAARLHPVPSHGQ